MREHRPGRYARTSFRSWVRCGWSASIPFRVFSPPFADSGRARHSSRGRLTIRRLIRFAERVERNAGYPSVENVGVEIGPVRPEDGAEFRIDAHRCESLRVAKLREHAVEFEELCEVHLASDVVFEP